METSPSQQSYSTTRPRELGTGCSVRSRALYTVADVHGVVRGRMYTREHSQTRDKLTRGLYSLLPIHARCEILWLTRHNVNVVCHAHRQTIARTISFPVAFIPPAWCGQVPQYCALSTRCGAEQARPPAISASGRSADSRGWTFGTASASSFHPIYSSQSAERPSLKSPPPLPPPPPPW